MTVAELRNDNLPASFKCDNDSAPHCLKCGHTVESVLYETPLTDVPDMNSGVMFVHTGEKIMTVSCHGEIFSYSNWRGVLS